MSQNCECNNLLLLTANTQIGVVKVANPNLDGSGTITQIFGAGGAGSTLKSVIIKSTLPTTAAGMIRLYITSPSGGGTVLFKEVNVPIVPTSPTTTIPQPVLPTFSAYVPCNLPLEAGSTISASTQIGGSFNVITESLDAIAPAPLPPTCCNFKEEFPSSGVGKVSIGNPNLDGTGPITDIYTAPAGFNGSLITGISIDALQSTSIGMLRLFIKSGSNYFLMNEIPIPQSNQSGTQQSYKVELPMHYNLRAGDSISASTQNSESFGISVFAQKWMYGIA